MIEAPQLDEMRSRLEEARAALLERRLTDRDAWRLLGDAHATQRALQGTALEDTALIIARLTRCVWDVSRVRSSVLRHLGAPR